MSRSNRAEWAKRVERWQDSGLTAKEYAAETGLNASTLSYWKWRLGAEAKSPSPSRRGRGQAGEASKTKGTRGRASSSTKPKRERSAQLVELAAELVTASPASMLEVVLGDLCVRVPVSLDDDTLTRVVRAVGAAR